MGWLAGIFTAAVCRLQAKSLAYQLDFVTPGSDPAEAISRNVIRDSRKRRRNARRRPVTSQRLTTRVGLASRGSMLKPT